MAEDDLPNASTVAGDLRIVLGQLVRRLRENPGGSDLTKSQSSVLGCLEREGPKTATDLARVQGIRPQSMATIVAALEAAGLITRSPDPTDGRKTILNITDKAREQYHTGRLAREDWLTQAMTATLTADEIARVAAVIRLLDRIARS